MSWVTALWALNAGICLTLAGVQLLAWFRSRELREDLAFAAVAASVALVSLFELLGMHAESPAGWEQVIRWAHVPVAAMVVSLVVFIHLYFRGGRLWLIWTIVAVRAVYLLVNFAGASAVNYRVVTGLRQLTLLGEQVSGPIAEPSPWSWLGRLTELLLLAFVVDAGVAAWRRGYRRRALVVGIALIATMVGSAVLSSVMVWGHSPGPAAVSPAYMILILTMAHELGRDLARTERLARDLERHRAELAHVGRVVSLGQLSTALAHEINQPLAAILSNAEAGQRLLARGTPDPASLREIFQDIVADDLRADEVIQRIRRFVRREAVKQEPVDVSAAVLTVVRLVGGDAVRHQVTIRTDLSPVLPPVLGDRVQLQQVILNLVFNALDAVRDLPEVRREIVVSATADEERVEVTVRDRGPGIDPSQLETVFQPFYTTKPQGLGVGLSICRTILEDHAGTLMAENNPDGGATFRMVLPRADHRLVEGSADPSRPDRGVPGAA